MEEVSHFDSLGRILIMGGMNSRVGAEDDFIRDDEIDENLPLPEDYLSDQILKDRTSFDKLSGTQGHGKDLLNFCKSTSFKIMNGRWEEDEEIGKFTCFKPTGNSLVDYCLVREKDRCIIKSFRTGDISIHSDHAFLSVSLDKKSHSTLSKPNLVSKANCILERVHLVITEELRENYNCRFVPTADSTTRIEFCLRSDELKSRMQCLKNRLLKDDISVDDAVEELRNICITFSQQSFKKVNFSRANSGKKYKKYNQWFDDDCRISKKQVNQKRKLFQKATYDPNSKNSEKLKTEYFEALKEFNKLKRYKERNHWKLKKGNLNHLKTGNPKEFWRKMSSKLKKPADGFDKSELFEYFSELASDEHFYSGIGPAPDKKGKMHDDDNSNQINPVITDHVSESLDRKISREEIRKVIKNMKNNKAAGIDKIIPELLKGLDDQLLDVIEILLNVIFEKGVFPEEWTLGVITILFKDGETNDLNNYRGITLLSMLGKVLVGVLINRLIGLINEEHILEENQGGFRKGYRTTDHLFTLHALINHYIKVEKKALFLCFVDFRKAFDKVSHSTL